MKDNVQFWLRRKTEFGHVNEYDVVGFPVKDGIKTLTINVNRDDGYTDDSAHSKAQNPNNICVIASNGVIKTCQHLQVMRATENRPAIAELISDNGAVELLLVSDIARIKTKATP